MRQRNGPQSQTHSWYRNKKINLTLYYNVLYLVLFDRSIWIRTHMTDTTTAARRPDAFENLLLEQAQLCHEELKQSFRSMRWWEESYREKKIGYDEMVHHAQRELQNVRQFVEDTACLAGVVARLRGQNIRVI